MSIKVDKEKLKAMSREDKLRLYDLIQKKKEIQKEQRDIFTPHPGQMEVAKSKATIRFVSAGNGWGKTSYAVNELIWAMEGFNPIKNEYTKAPCTVVVVLDAPIKVADVWRKELLKWYNVAKITENKHGHPYVTEWIWPNGSQTKFMFHQQEQLAFESIEINGGVIYDEIPSRNVFVALSRGQRTKNSTPFQLLIGTPTHSAWARTDLYEPWTRNENPDVECFRGSTDENKANLAEGYLEKFSRLLTDDEKKVRLQGEFFDLGGLALAHLFKDSVHIIDDFSIPHYWPVIIAIDPHPSKSHVAVALAIEPDTGRKLVVKELAAKSTAKQFALQLLEFSKNLKVVDWVCDSLGQADTTGGEGFKSFIQVLNECGIRVRATTYEEKLDEEWIERIRGALEVPIEADNFGQKIPQLRVFKGCSGTIKDVKNVAWMRYKHLADNKPKLDISNKDFLACVKYALAAASKILPGGRREKPLSLGGSQGKSNVSIRARYFDKRRI